MKYIFASMILVFLVQCSKQKNSETTQVNDQPDTVVTESGLKVIFLEKGEGAKIEPGSSWRGAFKVYLDDSLIWNNDTLNGQWGVHNPGTLAMIKGASELEGLLREGDVVRAFLPPSIAYGEEGRGVVYPGATLEFQWRVLEVGDKKKLLIDTLMMAYEKGGMESSIETYYNITKASDSVYDTGNSHLIDFYRRLVAREQYEDAVDAVGLAMDNLKEDWESTYFRIKRVEVIQKSGQLERALDSIQVLKEEFPDDFEVRTVKEKIEQQMMETPAD